MFKALVFSFFFLILSLSLSGCAIYSRNKIIYQTDNTIIKKKKEKNIMRTLLSFSFAPQTLCGQAGQGMTTGQRLKKKTQKKRSRAMEESVTLIRVNRQHMGIR